MTLCAVAWYLLLSVLARLALVVTAPLALIGWLSPSLWSGWWVLYFDERATQAWEGKS